MAVFTPNLVIAPHRKSPSEIWETFEKRRKDPMFIWRNAQYDKQLRYFEGEQFMGGGITAMNTLGKPILRLGTATEMNRTISANRIAPIVLDHQSQSGRLPSSRVLPPAMNDEGMAKAEKQTKYLYSTYEMCSMPMQHVQAGFFLSALGDALYILEIDWQQGKDKPKRAVITGVDPRYAFPRWRADGWRKFDLWDVIVARPLSEDDLEDQYDYEARSGREDDRIVLTYVSPFQRTVLIGKDDLFIVNHVEWNLDFCPAVWMNNHITDGTMANADIRHILELQDYYNFVLNIRADGLYEMTYPVRGIKDPLEVGEGGQIPLGPNEVVALGEKGDIITSAPAPPPVASDMILQQVVGDMNLGAGTTSIRQEGMPDRSNVSGRAIQSAQHPESMRLDVKQIIQATAFIKMNSYLMALQEQAPLVGAQTFDINGMFQGKVFNEPFTPSADIAGWYRNKVVWDELLGMSKPQKMQFAVEGLKAGVIDRPAAMEFMGEEDPLGMLKRVEEDQERNAEHQAKIQASAQQIAQGAGGGPGGPGAPPGGVAQPEQGAPGAQPTRIMRPPQFAPPPLPGGVPQGVTLNAIRKVLAEVHLRGRAFAIGELALQGQSDAPQIAILDHRDHQKVLTAVKALAPHVKVTFMPEDKLPSLKEAVA